MPKLSDLSNLFPRANPGNGSEPEGTDPSEPAPDDSSVPGESGVSSDDFDSSLRDLFEEKAVIDPQLDALLQDVEPIDARELLVELQSLTRAFRARLTE